MQRSVSTQKNSKVSVITKIDAMLTATQANGCQTQVIPQVVNKQNSINHTDGKETCITMNGNDRYHLDGSFGNSHSWDI